MILMIDNYDSFTYNLVQYLGMCGREVRTIRNDALDVPSIMALKSDLIVISPGPGHPTDAGVCVELLQQASPEQAIFGVCLGFQAMVQAFGGDVVHAPYMMHGKICSVEHDGRGLFAGLPQDLRVTRYHSLIAKEETLPACIEVTARTTDQLIMGGRHRHKRIEGVQFHPEAYLTEYGLHMIRNMLI